MKHENTLDWFRDVHSMEQGILAWGETGFRLVAVTYANEQWICFFTKEVKP